jgi:hypothetical protein
VSMTCYTSFIVKVVYDHSLLTHVCRGGRSEKNKGREKMKLSDLTRRTFVKTASAGATLAALPGILESPAGSVAERVPEPTPHQHRLRRFLDRFRGALLPSFLKSKDELNFDMVGWRPVACVARRARTSSKKNSATESTSTVATRNSTRRRRTWMPSSFRRRTSNTRVTPFTP